MLPADKKAIWKASCSLSWVHTGQYCYILEVQDEFSLQWKLISLQPAASHCDTTAPTDKRPPSSWCSPVPYTPSAGTCLCGCCSVPSEKLVFCYVLLCSVPAASLVVVPQHFPQSPRQQFLIWNDVCLTLLSEIVAVLGAGTMLSRTGEENCLFSLAYLKSSKAC